MSEQDEGPAPPPEDPAKGGGFEVEPADEAPLPAPTVDDAPDEPEPELVEEADTRTVAERAGEAVPTTPDALPPPEGWPAEMWRFPLRAPGPRLIAALVAVFVVLDLVAAFERVALLAYFGYVLLYVFCLRVQQGIVGTSAAGKDTARGWQSALEFDYGVLRKVAGYLVLWALGFALPMLVCAWFSRPGLGVLIAAAASPYLAVVTLGWALNDGSLKLPWNALAWLARRPIAFLVGTLGWWALWYSQVAVLHLAEQGPGVVFVASLGLRAAALYLLLVSARALGVAGRSWTRWGYQDPA